MSERPTPETDCESGFFDMETAVGAAFARRIERERDEAREDAAHWKIECEIVQARLCGAKHERDNGIISEKEIIPKLLKLAERAIDDLGWFSETASQRLQEELDQLKEGAK